MWSHWSLPEPAAWERARTAAMGATIEEGRAGPAATGVTVELLATVDLAAEIEGLAGRALRMRRVTIDPGGVLDPVHDHRGRPGVVFVVQGTITDHRDGLATDDGPGLGWPEDRN